jgi:hypothetical protein
MIETLDKIAIELNLSNDQKQQLISNYDKWPGYHVVRFTGGRIANTPLKMTVGFSIADPEIQRKFKSRLSPLLKKIQGSIFGLR